MEAWIFFSVNQSVYSNLECGCGSALYCGESLNNLGIEHVILFQTMLNTHIKFISGILSLSLLGIGENSFWNRYHKISSTNSIRIPRWNNLKKVIRTSSFNYFESKSAKGQQSLPFFILYMHSISMSSTNRLYQMLRKRETWSHIS